MLNKVYMLAIASITALSVPHTPIQHFISTDNDTSETKPEMIVHFENVENQKIKDSFMEVMERYEALHNSEVTLVQGPIKSSTMQAQPVVKLSNLFGETKKYRVKLAILVRDSKDIKVADLPADVLTGWFAHELGHLVDYRPHSNFQMIFYGLKYVFSNKFKTNAEHAADYVAIRHGFRDEIIATKRFILEHDLLDETYKEKIRRYYMPIEEAEVWEHKHVPGAPEPEL
ncbi:hypothetical protein [Owenweeksia hongkongensis]|nr:hypothetical protein [Owenweeksia hongkongensis]